MVKPRLWTKDFSLTLTINFLICVTFLLLMAVISLYATNVFNASESQAGLSTGLFVISALFVRIWAGKYIDVIGRTKILYVALFLFLFSTMLYFSITSLGILYAIRFLHGMSFGMANTATATIINDLIPEQRRGEGTGYYVMSANLGMAIGPFLGMFIIQYSNFNLIFWMITIFSILSLFCCLFLRVPESKLSKEQLNELKSFRLRDFYEPAVIRISFCVAIVTFTYSSLLSFIFMYADEINVTKGASFFFLVYAIVLLLSRPFTGRIFDRFGENVVVYPSLVLLSLGFLLLSLFQQIVPFLLAGAMIGVGFGTIHSSYQAIAVRIAPNHRRGLATSTYYVFLDAGNGIGPYIIGLALAVISFQQMYLIMSIIGLVSLIAYYFLHVRYVKRVQFRQKKSSVNI